MVAATAAFPSNPFVGVLVALVLFAISRPIIKRVAWAEAKPWLVKILTVSLILHLLAAPGQIYVVDHLYHGVADWIRYDNRGAVLAPGFRHFDFSVARANLGGIVNNGSVSIAAGIVFTFVGVNQVAGFLVFSWLAFLGSILFFRAFSLTFAGADLRRYAYLLFFFPSLIFWTADVSKEAIMMLALGITSYGAAKMLARQRGGFILVIVGAAIGIVIRPNDLLVMMAGFTVGMMVAQSGAQRNPGGVGRVARLLFFGLLLAAALYFTLHYLHSTGKSFSLSDTAKNNSGSGAGFGSGGVPYSTNPITYPRDIYSVLLDPLPINAHSASQLVAALENTVIIVLFVTSYRHLRILPRASIARAYVMMCAVYSVLFIYSFAALGNLGLITRERTLLFPFLLVLLCIPRSPKGSRVRYEWELRRRDRLRMRIRRPLARPGPDPRRRPPEGRVVLEH